MLNFGNRIKYWAIFLFLGIDLVHFHMTESNEKLELLMAEEKERVEAKGERIKIGPFVKTMAKKRYLFLHFH